MPSILYLGQCAIIGQCLVPVCLTICYSIYMSGTCGAGAELLRNERDLTTKVGEQPWPQLVHCASIDCRACGCIFQED